MAPPRGEGLSVCALASAAAEIRAAIPTPMLIVFFMRLPQARGAALSLRPTVETAADTVARFRTVDASINKGHRKKRQLRKLPAPRYVISRAVALHQSPAEELAKKASLWLA